MLIFLSIATAQTPTPTTAAEVTTTRPAPKTPVSLGLGIGADLFTTQVPTTMGVQALVRVRASESFAVEVQGEVLPSLGQQSRFLSEAPDPTSPIVDRTRPTATAAALAVFTPVRGVLNRPSEMAVALDAGLGFGFVHTVDDLVALQSENDPAAIATARQLHPTLAWSVGPRLDVSRRTSVSLRVDGIAWVETYESLGLERTSRIDGSVAVSFRL